MSGFGQISVTLSPSSPGTLTGTGSVTPILWQTTLLATGGLPTIQWGVFSSNGSMYGSWVTTTLSGGQATINVPFYATGDFLAVRASATNSAILAESTPVTITAPLKPTITLTPTNPGSLAASANGSTTWTTSVLTTGGLSQVQWAVYTSAGQPRSSWNITNLVGTSVSLTVTFLATGDYLVVTQVGNPSVSVKSSAVIIVGAPSAVISLVPASPGVLPLNSNGIAPWTTTVTATGGLTQVQYQVFTAASIARGPWIIVPLQNGSTTLTVDFVSSGDYLIVTEVNNLNISVYSSQVTLTSGVVSITLNPVNPGSIQLNSSNVAPWTTQVTTTGNLTEVQWAIFTSANVARSVWNVIPLVNNTVTLTVDFIATGDYLQVTEVNNTGLSAMSGAVSVSAPPAVSIAISPKDPGTINTTSSGAAWVTTITANSLTQVQWQVFSSAGVGRGGWQIVTLNSQGTAVLSVAFQATGDYLQVTKVGDTTVSVKSSAVTIVDASNGSLQLTALQASGQAHATNNATGVVSALSFSTAGYTGKQTQQASGSVAVITFSNNGIADESGTINANGVDTFFLLNVQAHGSAESGAYGTSDFLGLVGSGTAISIISAKGTADLVPSLLASGTTTATDPATAQDGVFAFSASGTVQESTNLIGISPLSPGTLTDANPTWQVTLDVSSSAQLSSLYWGIKDAQGSFYGILNTTYFPPQPVGVSVKNDITLSPSHPGPFTSGTTVSFTVNSTQGTLYADTYNFGISNAPIGPTQTLVIQSGSVSFEGTIYENGDVINVYDGSGTDSVYTFPVTVSTQVPPPAPPPSYSTVITATFTNTGDYLYVEDPTNSANYVWSNPVTIARVPSLGLKPQNIGTVTSGELVTIDVVSDQVAQAQYGIYQANTLVGSTSLLNMTGTSLQTNAIVVSFSATGQYLSVSDTANTNITVSSGTVTIAAAQGLSFNPVNPGTVPSATPRWFTVLEASPPITDSTLQSVQYAVFNNNNVIYGSWTTADLINGASLEITATFSASGDYLQAKLVNDPTISTVSNSVTISGGTTTQPVGGVITLSPNAPGTLTASSGVSPTWTTTVAVVAGNQAPTSSANTNYATPQSSVSSVSATYTKAQGAGNTNIVVVGWNDTTANISSVTDSNKNTYSLLSGPTKQGTALTQALYAAYNIQSGTNTVTVSFSPNANIPDLRIMEFGGVSTAEIANGAAGNGTLASVTFVTTKPNEIMVGGVMTDGAVTGVNPGWTQFITSPDQDNAQWLNVATTGTITMTGTLAGTANWVANMAAMEPTSYAGALPTQVQWAVYNSAGTAYTAPNTLDLVVGTNSNSQSLTVTFSNSGDYLHVNEIGGTSIYANSGTVTIAQPGLSSPVDMTGWTNVFYDDFSGTSLNSNNWNQYGSISNFSGSAIDLVNSAASVNNGFVGEIYNSGGQWYGTGLQTKPTWGNNFRIEMKVKVPPAAGIGPYFEMTQVPSTSNDTPAFDLAEFPQTTATYAGQIATTWHSDGNTSAYTTYYSFTNPGTNSHVLTMELTSKGFQFWIDGTAQQIPAAWNSSVDATTQYALGIGCVAYTSSKPSSWYGTTNSTTPNPFYFYIDYVAAWTPSSTPTDLQFAQNFASNLKMGINVERFDWPPFNGSTIDSSPAYWKYLTSYGITHVRFFLNYGFGGGAASSSLTQSSVQTMCGVVKQALSANMKVVMEFCDVTAVSDYTGNVSAYNNWVSATSTTVKSFGFDPNYFACGPINEYAGSNNATWNPIRLSLYSIVRNVMGPNYILSLGACNWKYYGGSYSKNTYDNSSGLTDGTFQFPSSDRVLYDVHNYDSQYFNNAVTTYQASANAISSWQKSTGNHPVYIGECGIYNSTFVDYSDFPTAIVNAASGAGQYAPCPWTVTTGTYGRLNNSSSDASLVPAIATAFSQASAFIASQPYYNSSSR